MICEGTPTYGWVFGLMGGLIDSSCDITNNQMNLELIKIIQFCVKFYESVETPLPTYGWVGIWVVSCQITKMKKKSWPN